MGTRNYNLNKSGISGVIVTVLLVGLAVVMVAIVWGVVINLVSTTTETTTSCFGNFNKVELNRQYTCYNLADDKLQFSVSIGDINVSKVIVIVSGGGSTKNIELNRETTAPSDVTAYNNGEDTKVPEKNSGKTYIFDLGGASMPGKPDSIKISPVISGNQCETSDTIVDIEYC